MSYKFYDSSYRYPAAKWWHILNVVSCYNSKGGLNPISIERVYCLRLWSLELKHITVKYQ